MNIKPEEQRAIDEGIAKATRLNAVVNVTDDGQGFVIIFQQLSLTQQVVIPAAMSPQLRERLEEAEAKQRSMIVKPTTDQVRATGTKPNGPR